MAIALSVTPPKHVSYQYVTVSNEDRTPFNIPWTKKLSYSDIISSSNVKTENIQGIEFLLERLEKINLRNIYYRILMAVFLNFYQKILLI